MLNKRIVDETIHCFDNVVQWLFLAGHPRQAAFWLGCFDQACAWTGKPVEPEALSCYHQLVTEVCQALGEEVYITAWRKGYEIPIEDALPLALQVMEQTAVTPQK
jgi:hypothetical protein